MLWFLIVLSMQPWPCKLLTGEKLGITLHAEPESRTYYLIMVFGSHKERRHVIPDTGSFYTVMKDSNDAKSDDPIKRQKLSDSTSLKYANVRQKILDRKCKNIPSEWAFRGSKCQSRTEYGLGQVYEGHVVVDHVTLPEASVPNFNITQAFSCTKRIPDQPNHKTATGILGLRPRRENSYHYPSFSEILFGNSLEPSGMFSICLSPEGGKLTFNAANTEMHIPDEKPITVMQPPGSGMTFTEGQVMEIYLEGALLYKGNSTSVEGHVRTFDTGRNMISFPEPVYKSFTNAFSEFCQKRASNCAGNNFYNSIFTGNKQEVLTKLVNSKQEVLTKFIGSRQEVLTKLVNSKQEVLAKSIVSRQEFLKKLISTFPSFEFVLYGSQKYTVKPEGYLIPREATSPHWAYLELMASEGKRLGIGNSFMISHNFVFESMVSEGKRLGIGNPFMINHDFVFNEKTKELTIYPSKCTS